MGIVKKVHGRDKEKKADKAAKEGRRLPGPLGDGPRNYLLFRLGEKAVEDQKK